MGRIAFCTNTRYSLRPSGPKNMIKCVLQRKRLSARCVMRTTPCSIPIRSSGFTLSQGRGKGMEVSQISRRTCVGQGHALREKHVDFLKPDARIRTKKADAAGTRGIFMSKFRQFLPVVMVALACGATSSTRTRARHGSTMGQSTTTRSGSCSGRSPPCATTWPR